MDTEAQASGAERWRHRVGDNVERGSAGSVQSVLAPPAPPAPCTHAHLDKAVSTSSASQLPASKDGPVATSAKVKLVDSNAVVALQQPVKDSTKDILHRKRTERRARSRVATATAVTAAATARHTATTTDGGSRGKRKTDDRNRISTASNRSDRRLAKLSFRGRPTAIGDAKICTSAKQRYS